MTVFAEALEPVLGHPAILALAVAGSRGEEVMGGAGGVVGSRWLAEVSFLCLNWVGYGQVFSPCFHLPGQPFWVPIFVPQPFGGKMEGVSCFTWWFNQPGPSIFPKRTPMAASVGFPEKPELLLLSWFFNAPFWVVLGSVILGVQGFGGVYEVEFLCDLICLRLGANRAAMRSLEARPASKSRPPFVPIRMAEAAIPVCPTSDAAVCERLCCV